MSCGWLFLFNKDKKIRDDMVLPFFFITFV